YEAEYVARAAARIEDAVGRCFPPPPPPGLLDAQEAWASTSGSSDRHSPAEQQLMLGGSALPSRKLVAGVVRSITTELEMAKSDARLSAAVAQAAATAVSSFVATCEAKLAATMALVRGTELSPALAKFCVGLVNAAESLRAGLSALCESEYSVSSSSSSGSRRLRQIQNDGSKHRRSQSSVSTFSSVSDSQQQQQHKQALFQTSDTKFSSYTDSQQQQQQQQQALLLSSSAAMVVRDILDNCSHDLLALISRQAMVLLDAADAAITEAILNSDTSDVPFEAPMQWLQTQVLEPLETDIARRPLSAMVDRFLSLYTRVVCLTFPLTEEAKLKLTAEVTQFEFACSQLIAATSSKATSSGGGGGKLADLGRSYRALRLMRPLLFTDIAELARIVDPSTRDLSSSPWSDLPVVDLVDHVVCRIATEQQTNGAHASSEAAMPYAVLGGWSKRQWIELTNSSGLQKTNDVKQALVQSLEQLALLPTITPAMKQLIQAATAILH
ncbi:hypothetical protein GGI21_004413, partial [Coemansia aciculifera]